MENSKLVAHVEVLVFQVSRCACRRGTHTVEHLPALLSKSFHVNRCAIGVSSSGQEPGFSLSRKLTNTPLCLEQDRFINSMYMFASEFVLYLDHRAGLLPSACQFGLDMLRMHVTLSGCIWILSQKSSRECNCLLITTVCSCYNSSLDNNQLQGSISVDANDT